MRAGASPFNTAGGSNPFSTRSIRAARSDFRNWFSFVICAKAGKQSQAMTRTGHTMTVCNTSLFLIAASVTKLLVDNLRNNSLQQLLRNQRQDPLNASCPSLFDFAQSQCKPNQKAKLTI